MEVVDLEKIAAKERISISNFKMNNCKARIINYDGYHIFIDYSKIKTYIDEKCCLAEEIGHYYYDSFYTLLSDQEFIDKQEYKATKWKSLACVPLNSFLSCFKDGITNLYDIAEKLQVEPNMVQFAYNYYINSGKLFTNDECFKCSI